MARRLVVDARLLPYNQAGIGRYLRHLYRALAALPAEQTRGWDVNVLYARKDRGHELRDCWPGEAVAWTPPHHRLERWTLALEVARLRPALVHSPDHVAPASLGWRTVVTVHDLAFRLVPQSHSPASRAYYAGLERSVQQAARVICVSQATMRDLLATVPGSAEKVRVVYEAPDPAYALEPIRSPKSEVRSHGGKTGASAGDGFHRGLRGDEPAHAPARPYFVFVGTIEPRKNVAGIIRALAQLPTATRPELRLVGAPGTDYEDVRALVAALRLERDVIFLGPQPTAEVAALYRRALALVFPSFLEGFGLPIVEAMACGAPVITSDRSSMAEVAGGAALLVDPGDIDALTGAMDRVAADQALRQGLRARGLRRAAEFSWPRAAAETLAVFEEALHGA